MSGLFQPADIAKHNLIIFDISNMANMAKTTNLSRLHDFHGFFGTGLHLLEKHQGRLPLMCTFTCLDRWEALHTGWVEGWNMQNPYQVLRVHQRTVDGRNPAPVEVGSLPYDLQGFIHPRWCKISAINSMSFKIKKTTANVQRFPKSSAVFFFAFFECPLPRNLQQDPLNGPLNLSI